MYIHVSTHPCGVAQKERQYGIIIKP